jgi:SAM-dependent methyltransferase
MMQRLRSYYRQQQFDPDIIGLFVNPFYLARKSLRRAIAGAARSSQGRLLDVGCGSKPYRDLFDVPEYIGLEIDSEVSRRRGVADAYYDGTRFPFGDGRFDVVLCNQVLEHVFNPDEFLAEIRRVLVPGGRVVLTVPFVWDEHEQPYDYARYSSFGLRALMARHGLKVVEHHKLLDDASVLFQLANAYLFKISRSRYTPLNLLINAVVLAPVSLFGVIAGAVLPRNPDLFLDQLVIAERFP